MNAGHRYPTTPRAWLPKISLVGVLQADARLHTSRDGGLHLHLALAQPGGPLLQAHQHLPAGHPQQPVARHLAARAFAGQCVLLLGRGLQADAGTSQLHLQHLDRWSLVDGRDFLSDEELAAHAAPAPAGPPAEPDLFATTPQEATA